LTGNETLKQLGAKYGVPARTIQSWVRSFRKRTTFLLPEPGRQEVKQLEKQLEQAELKNKLLEEMLRLSEEHTGLELRKKFGTKQS
jgi:transposase-like protein